MRDITNEFCLAADIPPPRFNPFTYPGAIHVVDRPVKRLKPARINKWENAKLWLIEICRGLSCLGLCLSILLLCWMFGA